MNWHLKSKVWNSIYILCVGGLLLLIAIQTAIIDPYFHFHYPKKEDYYYQIDNQRCQNDGILRHFEYDGIITGTSMTECFKASEADGLFETSFVKVPYEGASYKEINDSVESAYRYSHDLSVVIRGLDSYKLFDDINAYRKDMGNYPTYLYDDNPFNDVNYLFNRDIIFKRIYDMKHSKIAPGILSFDSYSNWTGKLRYGYISFGKNVVCPDGIIIGEIKDDIPFTEEEADRVLENVKQNVTSIADEHPETTFFYFYPPYSVAWWKEMKESGELRREIYAERLAAKEILNHPNIKFFDFNVLTWITTDLNNYKDELHYGGWINSLMLYYMSQDKYIVNADNIEQLYDDKLEFYDEYDYYSLNEQDDYENDYMAEVKIVEQISGIPPLMIEVEDDSCVTLSNSYVEEFSHDGNSGFVSKGILDRDCSSDVSIADYLIDVDYNGLKFTIDDIGDYEYVTFWGRKLCGNGQIGVYFYDEGSHKESLNYMKIYSDLDDNWHQYVIDITELKGKTTIIFNGGYTDNTGDTNSAFEYSEIYLYR